MEYFTKDGLTLPKWDSFKIDGFLENLDSLIEAGLILADKIGRIEHPTFSDVVSPLSKLKSEIVLEITILNHIKNVVSNNYPGINELDEEASKRLSAFDSKIGFHKGLYSAYEKIKNDTTFEQLTNEEKHIINETLKSYRLNGINLSEDKQERLKELREKDSELSSKFASNTVKATDAWALYLVDSTEINDLSPEVQEILKNEATAKGLDGYLIPLKHGIYMTVMDLSNNRSLREKLWRAFNAKCSEISYGEDSEKFDNSNLISDFISNKSEQAKILGFNNFCELSIETKVSGSVGVAGVDDFLDTIASSSILKSEKEKTELTEFAKSEFGIEEIMPWDIARVSYLYQERFYSLNEEEVRKYFPFEKVLVGLFSLIEELFDCKIVENKEVVTWHKDAKFYEVTHSNGEVFSGFYIDIFEREGKKSGAWMESLTYKINFGDVNSLPTAFVVTNFRDNGQNNYLSHNEITTLFHEMGHAMHHLVANTNYSQTSMMNLEWDAVELPSQLLEEWAWQEDVLQSLSCHKDTGEKLPNDLFLKIKASKFFMAGIGAGAQTGLGLFDFNVHKLDTVTASQALELYKDSFAKSSAMKVHKDARRPHTFSHIFGGGYSAGYFSYNWANALVADIANTLNGSTNKKEIVQKYRKEILEYGASRPFIDSFVAFLGRKPDPKYLIPFLGLE